ncbi:MAG: CBS domain-containing protein [Rhodospirillales bacterium]|jgi:CBS domain-containing protein|nr:CBS domain-containing protein [Rhodospirillales bacterium]
MEQLEVNIGQILEKKGGGIVTANADTLLEAAAKLLTNKKIGVVLVCDENRKIVGLLSERDIIKAVGEHGGDAAGMKVNAFMSQRLKTCSPQDHPYDVVRTMHDEQFRHMPVVESGNLKGLVSIGDLLTFLLDEAEIDEQSLTFARLIRHL